jgi:type II secretory ATPase GspE/PulE/Tfp pilus assembly ATPase PilB-like protein
VLRFRNDGVLQEIRRMPARLFNSLAGRFKVMADLNPAQRDLPMDGRIHIHFKDKKFDVRLATCPSVYGESIVMRILDQSNAQVALEQLEFTPDDLETVRKWLHRPNGMILVTGPTGSGKTTLLYSCLNEINLPDRKLITIEDPVEYSLPGVVQTYVNRKAGLTFAPALRAFMRQDPDIVMAGEIRDLETAEVAAQIALTGHLMLSTLPVNSAVDAVLRLRDMGLEPFIITASLVGASAQRLARRICPNCKEEAASGTEIPPRVRKLARDGGYPIPKDVQFSRGRGCDVCRQSGYRGRIPLYELMSWSEPLATAFIGGASREELTYLAVEGGMKTMLADGVQKAAQGETTIEEVQRVLGVTS